MTSDVQPSNTSAEQKQPASTSTLDDIKFGIDQFLSELTPNDLHAINKALVWYVGF